MNPNPETAQSVPPVPPDNLRRTLAVTDPDKEQSLPHLGVVGDTYTILVSGKDTEGRFCIIDMHVPPGGGPPYHRHDFEESFTLLEGTIEATFRGKKSVVGAGATVHIPANAPHSFANVSPAPARLLCVCSPAGLDDFFLEIGIPVATRTTPPPRPDHATEEAMKSKTASLLEKYRTVMVIP